jgi:hypothetical protein
MQVVSQREPLYVRISNILREYNQSNIIQEYIQNADDANASRIVCVVDHRKLKTFKNSSLLKHCAEEGALWIHNDSLFTRQDFDGILSLGVGGKRDIDVCTGQFGLGFNSSYSILLKLQC